MFGLLSDIREFLSLLSQLSGFLILGAVIAGAVRLLSPFLGLVSSVAAGAAIMFVAFFFGFVGNLHENDRLEAELKVKTAQLEISKSTTAALQKSFMDEALANEHNAGALANLRKQINAMGDKPECGVSKDFTDALKDIR